jgi:hypothetical protein
MLLPKGETFDSRHLALIPMKWTPWPPGHVAICKTQLQPHPSVATIDRPSVCCLFASCRPHIGSVCWVEPAGQRPTPAAAAGQLSTLEFSTEQG